MVRGMGKSETNSEVKPLHSTILGREVALSGLSTV